MDLRHEIILATVIGVEGLPCSILRQKKIFTTKGEELHGNLKLPWNLPMTWIEEQLAELVTGDLSKGELKVADLINPDEPDQIVQVVIASEMVSSTDKETLQKIMLTTHNNTPQGIRT